MNLIELALQHQRTCSYNNYEFTILQTLLYDLFVEAMENGRHLLIPSRSLPRACGKTVVLQKLSHEYGLYVVKNNSIVQYDAEGNERTMRGMNLRGIRADAVLIDEPTTFSQAQQKGAFEFICLGYKDFDIDQSFRSLVDIATVELEVDELRKEGKLYEHHRENHYTRNQELYSRELDTLWRWEAFGSS